MVTWDEAKRRENIRKHELDFVGCEAIFSGPVISEEDARSAYSEQRINVIGFLRGEVVFMTYTERGNDLHVISLRRATRHETKRLAQGLPHHP